MSFSETRTAIEAEIRRRWAERLYSEYDHVLYTYRVRMRRPVIVVEDLPGKWGQWDPLTRTLSLATRLLTGYPWESVLEIFKHEIAHQMVTDVYDSDESHGVTFRNACYRLGTAEWACRAQTDLEAPPVGVMREEMSLEEDRLLARVEKLLALATSNNEHEAVAAMEKVQELYAKYNLERLRDRRRSQLVYLMLRTKRKRIERYHMLVCSILNEHFLVKVIHTTGYDSADLCDYKVIELLGTRENVLMAEYVYHFLLQQSQSQWLRFKERSGKHGRARNSYVLGMLSGFREKLERHREQKSREAQAAHADNPWALVVQPDEEIEDFVHYRYPRLVNIKKGRRYHDADIFDAGKADGHKLVLHRAVNEGQGSKGKFLVP